MATWAISSDLSPLLLAHHNLLSHVPPNSNEQISGLYTQQCLQRTYLSFDRRFLDIAKTSSKSMHIGSIVRGWCALCVCVCVCVCVCECWIFQASGGSLAVPPVCVEWAVGRRRGCPHCSFHETKWASSHPREWLLGSGGHWVIRIATVT